MIYYLLHFFFQLADTLPSKTIPSKRRTGIISAKAKGKQPRRAKKHIRPTVDSSDNEAVPLPQKPSGDKPPAIKKVLFIIIALHSAYLLFFSRQALSATLYTTFSKKRALTLMENQEE